MGRQILAEVEFEVPLIRFAYLTCPECGKKFNISDLNPSINVYDVADLKYACFTCPVCGEEFGRREYNEGDDKICIREVDYPDCAKGACKKIETWEVAE